jgi:WW domain.
MVVVKTIVVVGSSSSSHPVVAAKEGSQEQVQVQEQPLKTTNAQSGLEFLHNHWVQVLTDAGEPYYWNMDTNQTTWQRPGAP